MSTVSVWDLIQRGHLNEACDRAESEFRETGSLLPLRNKVFALLLLGKLEESVRLSKQIIGLNQGNTDSDFIFLGVSHWIKHEADEAITAWKMGLATKYTDAAGGVEIPMLMLFAATSTQNEDLRKQAIRALKKVCRSKRVVNWPGPLALYVLGNISEEQLNSSLTAQMVLRAKQACQVDFHTAAKLLAAGDHGAAKQKFEACLGHGTVCYANPEPYLSKAELQKLS